MGKVIICEHPLIQHKLTHIRNENTNTRDFRQFVEEVSMLIAYEMTKDLPLTTVQVRTPVQQADAHVLAGKTLGLVPILRAGLGMVEGVLRLYPTAKIGHVGLYRDSETLQPVEYYVKLPQDVQDREMVVLDPMLATGGSAIAAISLLKKQQCRNIKLMSLIAAPEGVEALHKSHPDVAFYTAAVDSHLDEKGYIVPGLGDAGDRLFGTH